MATVVKSMATAGVEAYMVEIEAGTIKSPQQIMSIIGLPDQAIKEAGERIQAAIESCGYEMPKEKIIISLAPGDKKKRGSHFDLGMIIALLRQTRQIQAESLGDYAFIGEWQDQALHGGAVHGDGGGELRGKSGRGVLRQQEGSGDGAGDKDLSGKKPLGYGEDA